MFNAMFSTYVLFSGGKFILVEEAGVPIENN